MAGRADGAFRVFTLPGDTERGIDMAVFRGVHGHYCCDFCRYHGSNRLASGAPSEDSEHAADARHFCTLHGCPAGPDDQCPDFHCFRFAAASSFAIDFYKGARLIPPPEAANQG